MHKKKQVMIVLLIGLLALVFFSAGEKDEAVTGYATNVPCDQNNEDRDCAHLTENGRPYVCRPRVPWKPGTRGGFWGERNFAREPPTCHEKVPVEAPCQRDAHCITGICNDERCTRTRPAPPANERNERACGNDNSAGDDTCRRQVDNQGRPYVCRLRVPWKPGTQSGFWGERNFAVREAPACRQKIPANGPCTRNEHCVSRTCNQEGRCARPTAQPNQLELTPSNIRKLRTTQETIRPGVFKETTRYEIRQRDGPPVPIEVQETRSGCFDVQKKQNAAFTILFIGDGYASPSDLERDVKKLAGIGTSGGLFSTKPFDQHINKFNLKAMIAGTGTREIGRSHSETGLALAKVVALSSSRKKANRCSGRVDYVVTLAKQDFRSICFPWLSCLVSVGREVNADDQKLFVHEFGHGFAGLVDEYVDSSVTEAFKDYSGIVNIIFQENIRDVMGLFEFLGVITPPNCVRTQAEANRWSLTFPHNQLSVSRGCGFSSRYYRSTRNSIMRDHTRSSFGPVSEKRILDTINGQRILKPNSVLYDVPGMLDTFTTIADITYALEDTYGWGEDAIDTLEEVWNDVADAVEATGSFAEELGEDIMEGAEDAVEAVGETAEDVGEDIAEGAEEVWDEVESWW